MAFFWPQYIVKYMVIVTLMVIFYSFNNIDKVPYKAVGRAKMLTIRL